MKKKIIALFTAALFIISTNSIITIASNDSYIDNDSIHMIEDPNAEITVTNNNTGNSNTRVFVGNTLTSISVTSLSPNSMITTRDHGLSIDPNDTPTNKVGVEYNSNVSRQKVGICYYNSTKDEFTSEGYATTSLSVGSVSFNVNYVSGKLHFAYVKNLSSSTITNSKFTFIGM